MAIKETNGIYVNKEISSSEEDILGISTQVDSIVDAIDDGASMIGVVGDFGSGKSSVSEMLSKKKKFKKVIRINMWDSLRSKDGKVDEDTLISLDKTFLYQLAFNSGKKNLARHVNKRLNKNNGFISFTLKSLKFWIYFAISMLFVALGIIIYSSNFSLNICDYVINRQIYWMSYLIAAIVILVGLRKSSIAFSSWKSEGEKKFDSSDAFSIFSEIVDCTKGKGICKKKTVVVIEDLDRLGKSEYNLIVAFIKEIYRFSNLSKQYYSFIVAIKPAVELAKSGNEQLDYDKTFDYIVELKPIHIDDFNTILKNLIHQKQEFLQKLTGMQEDNLVAELSLLVSGENLSIRKLKHRLNALILLYQSLKNKHKESNDISIKSCCVVVYLQNQYPKDYQYLITSEELFNNIIRQSYTVRLDTSTALENKTTTLENFISQQQTKQPSGQSIFDNMFCHELSSFLVSGIINSDFRQYFYSYPKDSYIKTVEESELYNQILFPQDMDAEELDTLVFATLERSGKVIDDAIMMLKNRSKVIPTFILRNEQLFKYCYEKFPDEIIKTMKNNLLWNQESADNTISILSTINHYYFDGRKHLFETYSSQIAPQIASLGDTVFDCRLKLIQILKDDIRYFAPIFLAPRSPQLTDAEIMALPNEDTIFTLLGDRRINHLVLESLNKRFKCALQPCNAEKTVNDMCSIVASTGTLKELALNIVQLLKNNLLVNDTLFEYAITCGEIHDDIVEYINTLSDIPSTYCSIIDNAFMVGDFKCDVIEKLYKQEYYTTFLANAIHNVVLLDKWFVDNVSTNDNLYLLYKSYPDLFIEYREQLLSQPSEIKEKLSFVFNGKYPFISSEIDVISSKDCTILFDTNTIINNPDAYIQACNHAINDAEDLYVISMFVLGINGNQSLKMFNQLDFGNGMLVNLDEEKQNAILQTYETKKPLTTVAEIVGYMRLTKTLNTSLEQRLLVNIQSGQLTADSLKEYYAFLEEINACNKTTLEIISVTNYMGELPTAVTNELYSSGEYERYIIGKTLKDNTFEYDSDINLNHYRQVYSTVPKVAKFMIQNQQLLDQIYFSKDFSDLNQEQVFRYKDWDQVVELFKSAMEIANNDTERKNYIKAMLKFATLEDSNSIVDYICQEKYVSILLDDEIKNKIMSLLWNENPGKKIKLTKFVNKYRDAA